MKRIIDTVAGWLVALDEMKAKVNDDFATFMKRGNNGLIFGLTLFGTFILYWSFQLYRDYGKMWLALIPILFFIVCIFIIPISDAYKEKVKQRNRSSRMRLVGFHMDFNERILRNIYGSLTRYEFVDEHLTSFEDFYHVLMLDFEEHDSVLHFNCTQPQLKYILDRFKQLKKGLSLKAFERSQKVYHKGNPISAGILSKKYNEFPPDRDFEQLVDSFFDFLGDI